MSELLVFEETLDPDESKTFVYNWASELGEDGTIASQIVTMVDAAGATNPADSHSGGISYVKLAGGTPGARVIFTIRITKGDGDTVEKGFGVDVQSSTYTAPVETEAETLTRYIAEAKAKRHEIALGSAVIEVWRDGRRMKMTVTSVAQLDGYIAQMGRDLAALTNAALGKPRRRAIGTYF